MKRVFSWLLHWPVAALVAGELPVRVDHSTSPHFPPIVRQTRESCAQDAGIYYMLSYEWNRSMGSAADVPERQLAGGFAWHFLNRGENRGAELAEGWQLARAQGVPTVAAYQEHTNGATILGDWPDGYALYHNAMTHRVQGYRFFPLATAADLETAKRWLYERGDERERPGGLLAIEGRLKGSECQVIPAGQFESGKSLITQWGRQGKGHVMTYVGYDDRVGHDVNGDGRLTNDVDLNADGKLTLADWERGAFIAVNSHGSEWGDEGKTYVLYRESAVTPYQRGRWAAAVKVWPEHVPRLTLKLKLQANCQAAMNLQVLAAGEIFTPWFFPGRQEVPLHAPLSPEKYSRYVTGKRRLALGPLRPGNHPVEIGVDLTGHLPLHAEAFALRYWLDQDTYPHAEGAILNAALRRYDAEGELVSESAFAKLPQAMSGTSKESALSF